MEGTLQTLHMALQSTDKQLKEVISVMDLAIEQTPKLACEAAKNCVFFLVYWTEYVYRRCNDRDQLLAVIKA